MFSSPSNLCKIHLHFQIWKIINGYKEVIELPYCQVNELYSQLTMVGRQADSKYVLSLRLVTWWRFCFQRGLKDSSSLWNCESIRSCATEVVLTGLRVGSGLVENKMNAREARSVSLRK